MDTKTVFPVAVSYGVKALVVSAVGLAVAGICSSTILKIIGLIAAFDGVYAFAAIALCAFSSKDLRDFQGNVVRYVTIACTGGVSKVLDIVIKKVFQSFFSSHSKKKA